jgi:hypothetical protein
MFGSDRNQLRKMYFEAWRARDDATQSGLHQQICAVIAEHPEYHGMFEEDETAVLAHDFSIDSGISNPFMHLGMHLAIREQLATQRPPELVKLYQRARLSGMPTHEIEHDIMEALGHALWQAQRNNTAPDEVAYISDVKTRFTRKLQWR